MDALELDALKEIVTIGTARSAEACSELLDKKVMIEVPEAKLLPLAEVPAYLGGSDLRIVGIYFQMTGDMEGRILLMFEEEAAEKIADELTMGMVTQENSAELKRSSLMELGNIIANSYINGLAEVLDMKLAPSVPFFANDMLGAVIDFLLIEISQVADRALVLKTDIKADDKNINAHFLLFPDENLLKKIFEKLGLEAKG